MGTTVDRKTRCDLIALFQQYFPAWIATILAALTSAGVLVTFIALSALFFIWLERKVAARIQDRLGPTRVGGRFGWLQTLADGIKLLTKEDTIPTQADRFLFTLAPIIAFCSAFAAFIVLPFSPYLVGFSLSTGAFFILAVLSSEVFGVILAGYASASKWSLFGAIREAAQVVSYEVPRALCVLIPIMLAGSLDLTKIAQQQSGGMWNWFIFHDPFTYIAFFIFFICATASCKRAPFDLAEAESELVAGFHTEYSGLRWSFFFMAEYGSMFAVSAIAVILFLGGWHSGVLPSDTEVLFGPIIGSLINMFVYIVMKCWLLIFVMMWLRWSLPRLRIDQVMMTCLQYFLPISAVLLLGATTWQLFAPIWMRVWVPYLLFAATILGVMTLIGMLARRPTLTLAGELPGVWLGRSTPFMRAKS